MELSDGTLFARDFRILRRLDSGGMGAVYVALQESTGMERAVKVMHPQLVTDPSLRKRFEQEARVASRIASEHVVQVVGAGVDDATGAPFLAMELLRGESLAQHLSKRGAMTLSETREFLVQLTHALGAAHAAGVVHRDLKPENLFLAEARRADAQFTVKVLDFGIAKIVADAVTTGTAALGSPIWMAPEQTSRGTLIAPATDVWALGLIVFRMLTGHLFWREAEHPQGSMTGLLREVLLEPIGTASARASEQGAGYRLPPGFDSWFARCVVREPHARFRDAVEAFRGIDGLLRMVTSGGVAATVLDPSTPSALARSGTEIAIPPWQPPLLSKRSRVGLWVGLVAGGLGLLVLIGGLLVFFSAGDSDTDEALQSSIRRGREPGYVQPATVRASAFVEKSRQESWGPELAF
ncbi:MAG: serine/threonine-protein kinase, partial [Myxococcales bacterium]